MVLDAGLYSSMEIKRHIDGMGGYSIDSNTMLQLGVQRTKPFSLLHTVSLNRFVGNGSKRGPLLTHTVRSWLIDQYCAVGQWIKVKSLKAELQV